MKTFEDEKTFICNLLDGRSVKTGYEQVMEKTTEKVARDDYLYWLFLETGNHYDDDDIEIIEKDWEDE